MADYGSAEYWDARYRREEGEPFEWYQTYDAIKPLLGQHLAAGQRVLVLGCGTSALAAQLAEDSGAAEVQAVDFSAVAVAQMKERHAASTTVRFRVMDATRLDFVDGTFDVAVDKGTMDSVLCSEQGEEGCRRMCRSVARALKPGGVYFALSHSAPENRKPYLQAEEALWEVFPHQTVAKPAIGSTAAATGPAEDDEVHYVYVARRRESGVTEEA